MLVRWRDHNWSRQRRWWGSRSKKSRSRWAADSRLFAGGLSDCRW